MKKLVLLNFLLTQLIFILPAQNLHWLNQMGGSDNDASYSIAVDDSGNVYTAGSFGGTADFDPGAGTMNLTSTGDKDIFIQKVDASGDLVWANSMGGTGWDQASSIAIDNSGNVFATGFFSETADFDPGTGTVNLSSNGGFDIFAIKLDVAGNLVWAKQMGGTDADEGKSITVDATGNVYLTGRFQKTVDFDPGTATMNLTSGGGYDFFVQKLDASGNLVWATKTGGANTEDSFSIATDNSGNVFTTGYFEGNVDFDPGSGALNFTTLGSQDIFVQKLDPAGALVWAKQIGGTGVENGYSIAVNDSGNVYTTGLFYGTVDFDPNGGAANLTADGLCDIFIQKMSNNGSYIWAKKLGGTGVDIANGIAVDNLGNAHITGIFYGTADFDTDTGTLNLTSLGLSDIFIQKLNTSGKTIWTQQMGGTEIDIGNSIAIDNSGNTYTTGSFYGTADFDAGPGSLSLTSLGVADIYALKSSICDTQSVPICMVGVDSTSTNNLIVWDKPITTNIDSFIIYREITVNNFQPIGSVHYSDLSEFYDVSPEADPNNKSYKYKIAILDSCGNEGGLSDQHKTIHLTATTDSNDDPLLQWNDYEGFTFSIYRILFDSTGNNSWTEVGTAPFGDNAYTVTTVPHTPYSRYVVEVVPPISCITDNTRSNITTLYIVSTEEQEPATSLLSIYPNPFSQSARLVFNNDKREPYKLVLYNVLGAQVWVKEDIYSEEVIIQRGNLNAGVYFIELQGKARTSRARIMID